MSGGTSLKEALRAQAKIEGFSGFGVCAPSAIPKAAGRLANYVAKGYHGQMGWMENRMNWRGDPTALWPEAKSVIMLCETYSPSHDPLEVLHHRDRAAISVYAQNRDYHDLVKKRLKRLGRWLLERATGEEIKVFVDTAPVMEKPLAAAAGLGWQGKHTNLVSQDLGNWFFLGAIFTTADLERDGPETDHCGSCRKCLDICPTNAFSAPYQLDARRCISYLTIEHSGPVNVDLRAHMGNRIYGCDDCLSVCPWNKFAQQASEIGYLSRPDIREARLQDMAVLNDAEFRSFFSKSPIKRIGRNRFVRNVLYAIGNSADRRLFGVAQGLVRDPDPTVQDAANWACERLNQKENP